ncbi:hypothetical protein [Chitinophaga niabensis]|uniref:Uncharacterized protein n=1 Tax=Chitinophaga niabensis TaxID=536979 RepID=A0A1N6DZA8_9BACT|nr:hypothetical protein [Chitinophaga niabensis]SIN76081.1 hypothetical protein SAMN04488055_1191 [Chitinophaga niabensis]
MAAAFEHKINQQMDAGPNRTDLLPWWIRYCNWLFILGIITVPMALILSLLGNDNMYLAAYGLTARNFFSPAGIVLAGVFLFNAFTAYALLTESDWAIDIAIADALIGITLCSYTMSATPGLFRYELIPLALFLGKLLGIRRKWEKMRSL